VDKLHIWDNSRVSRINDYNS